MNKVYCYCTSVVVHFHLTRAVSQHTDTSMYTKPSFKCCYALHSYVETIFSHKKLLTWQYPPSRNGDQSPEDGVWLPMRRGNTKKEKHRSHTQSFHPEACICQCTTAYTGWSQGVHLGNSIITKTATSVSYTWLLWHQKNGWLSVALRPQKP